LTAVLHNLEAHDRPVRGGRLVVPIPGTIYMNSAGANPGQVRLNQGKENKLMGTIGVLTRITLDGVVQGEGGPDEDPSDGFEHGGWARRYDLEHGGEDEVNQNLLKWEANVAALLFGRTTYELFANSWGVFDEDTDDFQGEITRKYNSVPKYVATTRLTELAWKNSHLLGPDVPAAVQDLRAEVSGEIRIWGSTLLIKTLAEHGLIDEYRLAVYPLVLGSGKKLFSDGFTTSELALVDTSPLTSGVVVNTYRRADAG
jgi:dihydrofolate reductase